MKNNRCKFQLASFSLSKKMISTLILVELIIGIVLPLKANESQLIISTSNNCFRSRILNVCKNALEKVVEFQLKEVTQDNYSCQTRLLGLESNLLMVIMNLPRKRHRFANFEELEKACSRFF